VLSFRSQFFQSLRHFVSHPNDRSTTQGWGSSANVTREIGILKSLGASRVYIIEAVLRETGLLAISGIILGLASPISCELSSTISFQFPTLAFAVTPEGSQPPSRSPSAAAILGAFYPAIKAVRKCPIDALSYE
jgi:putative ABC transport system permease protein